ncbi:carboxymuconolactone decarboxylase family protein [Mesorhizobium opportunistum]|uniref:Carboxymuconolactone decarboxylase family protein n=1 Tax=Mesorhizobium opportunistum TaxID=593909 RepID=A0ABV1YEH6_9HYPH|nr:MULTISPECIES: carboxymuconolactone decarboxylase family protein [Mesorhizobium]WJI35782.1 carboxymuconolactone decarboxylase family protein [Mesorhizobium opportunistum]
MALNKPASERFERGLKTRRAVLGDSYVERSLENATEFSWPMQELTTEWCWDSTWNREGLDRRSRSILNLGMIAALNRPHEFKVHVRGAINNGLSATEVQEICIQIGTYCGVPAAMDAFRLAGEVLKEMGVV